MMVNNAFLNWRFDVRPDSFRENSAEFLGGESLNLAVASKSQVRHQAFAIGFFGFHYICAANENRPLLQKESLQILRKFVAASDLDVSLVMPLGEFENRSYSDFWNNVLRKISLALGDSLGVEVQRLVEFGFWLAAVYACLVGILEENESREFTKRLEILELWMPGLLLFAEQARVSSVLIKPLAESRRLLQRSKTHETACKCMHIVGLAIRGALSPKTAVELN